MDGSDLSSDSSRTISAADSSSPPRYGYRRPDTRTYEPIYLPCEWVEKYRPGGFQPVHIGDVFNKGQYRIVRKLGESCFSTVWLANDLLKSKYVAIKIEMASPWAPTDKMAMLQHITQIAPTETTKYITKVLDVFDHHGPNGTHKCLVLELMGHSVGSMLELLPQFKLVTLDTKIRYPPRTSKSVLKQCLQALAFLHKHGIAHGDLRPENMLFHVPDIDMIPEDELRQSEDIVEDEVVPSISVVRRRDGKDKPGSPRYLCVAQPLWRYMNYEKDFKIKLSDLRGAYFMAEPPVKPFGPAALRAPEEILNGTPNGTSDIWSFGCLLFEFITGMPLFCMPWFPNDNDVDDCHLLDLTAALGPLPDNLYAKWNNSALYFTPDRQLFNCHLGGPPSGQPLMLEQHSMEELFDREKPDLAEEEACQVKALIRRILQYDPAKRPSAAEILRDPWFLSIN